MTVFQLCVQIDWLMNYMYPEVGKDFRDCHPEAWQITTLTVGKFVKPTEKARNMLEKLYNEMESYRERRMEAFIKQSLEAKFNAKE